MCKALEQCQCLADLLLLSVTRRLVVTVHCHWPLLESWEFRWVLWTCGTLGHWRTLGQPDADWSACNWERTNMMPLNCAFVGTVSIVGTVWHSMAVVPGKIVPVCTKTWSKEAPKWAQRPVPQPSQPIGTSAFENYEVTVHELEAVEVH